MNLRLGDTAPDFEAETTEGTIAFHDWVGDSCPCSHPRDFTPVCTTELGYMANIKPEFDRRNVKIIGLSVDPVDRHTLWASDIAETQGTAPNYPIISDGDFAVSKLYGMLPADVSGDPTERTPADNQTVRNVFVVGPDKKIKLILVYPMSTGRNFDEVLRHRLAPADRAAQRLDTRQLEGRRPGDHLGFGVERPGEGAVARGLGGAEALHPHRSAAGQGRVARVGAGPAGPSAPRHDRTGFRTCRPAARAYHGRRWRTRRSPSSPRPKSSRDCSRATGGS